MEFGGGTHTLEASSQVSGTGQTLFSEGTTEIGGSYAVTGETAIDGGTVNFSSGGHLWWFEVKQTFGFRQLARREDVTDGRFDYWEDTNGNRITAGYNAGRLTDLVHSSGQWLAIAYNGAGLVETVTDSDGRVTRFTYDGDHLTSIEMPDGQTTQYVYETSDNLRTNHALREVHKPTVSWFYSYDTQGRLDGITRDDGGACR